MKLAKHFLHDERGLETVEYAIIAGLVVSGLVAVVAAIATWVKGQFDTLKTNDGALPAGSSDRPAMWNTLFHHPLPSLQWGVVLGAALIAAWTDLRARRIPNLLTGPVFVGGLGVAAGLGGWAGLGDALLGGAIAALPFLFLFAFAAGGAGDAKLMAALGAWLGSVWGSVALVLVCLSGVLLGVLQAAQAGRLAAVLANVSGAARGLCVPFLARSSPDDPAARLDTLRASLPPAQGALTMPYGLAIASGMLLTAGGAWLWNAA